MSLARALYSRAELYLIDDPLAAMDTAVGRQAKAESASPPACASRSVLPFLGSLHIHAHASLATKRCCARGTVPLSVASDSAGACAGV